MKTFITIGLLMIPVSLLAPSSPRGAETYAFAASRSVALAWDPSPDGERYRIYWRRAGQTSWQIVEAGTNLVATIGGLRRKTSYYFTATALRGSLESVRSNILFYRTDND